MSVPGVTGHWRLRAAPRLCLVVPLILLVLLHGDLVARGQPAEECTSGFGSGGDSSGVCSDIDECASGSHSCSSLANCTNSIGSFSCNCLSGFSGNGMNCTDIDECASGAHSCSPFANCTNSNGSFSCNCLSGFTGDGMTCNDIDECASGAHSCSPFANCTNSNGSFSCNCGSGFSGDGMTCSDINECASGAHSCSLFANCTNSNGSFSCNCLSGFTGDGMTCNDIDECASGAHSCSPFANCTNSNGSFSCNCGSGFSGDGMTCSDINECASGAHSCSLFANCTNSNGSFSCNCLSGFTGDGMTCNDIDECASGAHSCSPFANCTNSNGSFSCNCGSGFSGDGMTCSDINECASGAHSCSLFANCTNSNGSFSCNCLSGFTGDGMTCNDIDECASGGHSCSPFANCTNSNGSFSCNCGSGFSGDGMTCSDINECASGAHSCSLFANCTNSNGSFSCNCLSGFTGDGMTCNDIDECASGAHSCSPFANCTNSNGSFSCNCGSGFSGDGMTCSDINECASGAHSCSLFANCTNSNGSFSCSCLSGYMGNGMTCDDVNECLSSMHNCDQNAMCNNTIGNFTCTCQTGFVGSGIICDAVPSSVLSAQSTRVLNGTSLVITCNASGFGTPVVSWTHNGSPLNATSSSTLTSSQGLQVLISVINLTRAEFADRGVYACNTSITTNGNVQVVRETISITVLVFPDLSAENPDVEVLEGGRFKLTLLVSEPAFPNIAMNDVTWQLPDGSSLTANSTNVTLSLNNTVVSAEILSANGPQHRGNVSVTVSTEAGRRTVHFNVLVVVPPIISTSEPGFVAIQSFPFSLTCTVQSYPEASVVWLGPNGTVLVPSVPDGLTISMSTTVASPGAPFVVRRILRFATVHPDNNGTYTCIANVTSRTQAFLVNSTIGLFVRDVDECQNGSHDCHPNANCLNTIGSHICTCQSRYTGNGTSCFAFPVVTLSPSDAEIRIRSGSSLTLTCQSIGAVLSNISWMLNGSVIQETNSTISSSMSVNVTSSLVLDPIMASNTGIYTCSGVIVSASGRRFSDSATTNVVVLVLPLLIAASPTTIEVLEGASFSIALSTTGNAVPIVAANNFNWSYPSGENITPIQGVTFSANRRNLTLFNATNNFHFGTYVASLTTEAGTTTLSFLVRVVVLPSVILVPTPLVIINETDSLNVSCTVSSYPMATVQILAAGMPINSTYTVGNSGNQITVTRIVQFPAISLNQSASYTCTATVNTLVVGESSVSRSVDVTVQAPPVLAPLVISPSTTPIRRSNVSITARLGRPAFPYPVFSWTFNDTVLIASSRHAFQMNGTVLTIYGVSVNDTGRYTVSATNAVATVTTYIDVLVYVPPEFSATRLVLNQIAGDTVYFTAPLLFAPVPSLNTSIITWYRNTTVPIVSDLSRVMFQDGRQTLVLTSVSRSDSGDYTVRIPHETGAVNQTYTLFVHELPVILEPLNTSQVVNTSQNIVLNCQATGFPQPMLTWSLNGTLINSTTGRLSVSSTTTFDDSSGLLNTSSALYIQQAAYSDTGRYFCQASVQLYNGSLVHATSSVMLIVNVPPVIELQSLMNISVEQGSDVSFIIRIADPVRPSPSISWSGPLGPITDMTTTKYRLINGNLELNVLSVARNDSGFYHVIASNDAGVATFSFYLNVYVPPQIVQLSADREENITLSSVLVCSATSHPEATITWYFMGAFGNSIPLPNGSFNNRISIISTTADDDSSPLFVTNSTLTIGNLMDSDRGMYRCVASSQAFSTTTMSSVSLNVSRSLQLDVLVAPVLGPVGRGQLEAVAGENVTFWASIVPPTFPSVTASDLQWSRHGNSLPASDARFTLSSGSFQLTLVNVSRSDAGMYVLTATTRAGSYGLVFNLSVFVQPVIFSPINFNRVDINQTDDLAITCNITSYPAASVSFLYDNVEIQPSASSTVTVSSSTSGDGLLYVTSAVLVRRNIQFSQRGNYSCFVHLPVPTLSRNLTNLVTTSVSVQVPPAIVRATNSTLLVQNGSNAVFAFRIQGDVFPAILDADVRWDQVSSNSPSVSITNVSRVLSISDVQRQDAGIYTVTVRNAAGVSSLNFSLNVYVAPILTAAQNMTTVIETNDTTLECRVASFPLATIEWLNPAGSIITSGVMSFTITTVSNFNSGSLLHEVSARLSITATSFDRRGVYTCRARVTAGTMTLTSTLSSELAVYVPPVVTLSPADSLVQRNESDNFTVTCQSRGFPEPVVFWEDGTSMISVNSRRTVSQTSRLEQDSYIVELQLSIANLTDQDRGIYTCNSNIMLNAVAYRHSQQVQLDVLIKPTLRFTPLGATFQRLLGQNVTFHSEIQAPIFPNLTLADITWYGPDGLEITSSMRGRITLNSTTISLTVDNLNRSDDGSYSVRARNSGGMDSQQFSVDVFVTPDISIVGASARVNECDTFVTTCVSNSFPASMVYWLRNGVNITDTSASSRRRINGTTIAVGLLQRVSVTLTVENLTFADRGNYTCVSSLFVISQQHSVQAYASLQVLVRPRVVRNQTSVERLEGQTGMISVHLQSPVFPVPRPDQYVWRNPQGVVIANGDQYTISQDAQSIMIINVSRADAGNYNLTVTNDGGVGTALVPLEVYVIPTISEPANGTVELNRSSTWAIECVASGHPAPSISWYNAGELITTQAGRVSVQTSIPGPVGLLQRQSVTLQITNLMHSDTGLYQCRAEINVLNQRLYRETFTNLQVLVTPVIETPPMDNTTLENATVCFSCVVFAVPLPSISWSFNSLPITTNVAFSAVNSLSARYMSTLCVENVTVPSTGGYRCQASNTVGSASATSTLTVYIPPQVYDSPTGPLVVANSSNPARLVCTFRAVPQPVVVWRMSGEVVAGGQIQQRQGESYIYDAQLDISSVSRSSEGNYTCTGTNVAGNSQATVFLDVQVLPVVRLVNITFNSTYLGVEMMPLVVPLAIDDMGEPAVGPDNIVWTQETSPGTFEVVQNNSAIGRFVQPDSLALVIRSLNVSEEGNYRVTITNAAGVVTLPFTIEHEGPPHITQRPQSMIRTEGNTVTFDCSADADPLPNITWTFAGSAISTSGNRVVANMASFPSVVSRLTLSSITRTTDEGQYACMASNTRAPNAIAQATLTVYDIPVVTSSLQPLNIIEGNSAVIDCNVNSVPQFLIQWYHNGQPLMADGRIQFSNSDQRLTVASLVYSDRGTYECNASNTHHTPGQGGNVQQVVGKLSVYIAPRIVAQPQSEVINETSALTLVCSARGFPNVSMVWMHNGGAVMSSFISTAVTNSGMANMPALYQSTLFIDNTMYVHAGEYVCIVSNNITGFTGDASSVTDTQQLTASVDVQVSPTILHLTPPQQVVFPMGVMFLCNASGNPAPMISWTLPTREIVDEMASNRLNISSSVSPGEVASILPVTESMLFVGSSMRVDNGAFTCQARTPVSTVSNQTVLTVFEVPDAPSIPVVVSVASRSLVVNWSEPRSNNVAITEYNLVFNYTYRNGSVIFRYMNITGKEMSGAVVSMATLSALVPFQTYSVTVRAVNAIGPGAFSNVLMVNTSQDVPTASPPGVVLDSMSNVTILVTWSAIPLDDQHGIITAYETEYRQLDNDTTSFSLFGRRNTTGVDTSLLLDNLDTFRLYAVRVRGFTSVGPGPFSTAILIRTLTGIPEVPIQVEGVSSGSRMINVSWNHPDDTNGVIQQYRVTYWPTNAMNMVRQILSLGNNTALVITGLLPFTNYTFVVAATTLEGFGSASDIMNVRTDEDVPEAPTSAMVIRSNATFAEITWMAPQTPNGIILDYQIIFRGSSRFAAGVTYQAIYNTNGPVERLNATQLVAGSIYGIVIRGRTIAGLGSNSSVVTVTTNALAPPLPTFSAIPTPATGVPADIPVEFFPAPTLLAWRLDELTSLTARFSTYHVFVVLLGPASADTLPNLPPNPGVVYNFLLEGNRVFDVSSVAAEISTGAVPPAYIAAEVNSSVFMASDNSDMRSYLFQAGTGSSTRNILDDTTYVNAPLREEYAYTVFVRGYVDSNARRRRRATAEERAATYGQFVSGEYGNIQMTTVQPSSGLSGGAVAAIVICLLIFFSLLGLAALWYWRRYQHSGKVIINPRPTGMQRFDDPADTSIVVNMGAPDIREDPALPVSAAAGSKTPMRQPRAPPADLNQHGPIMTARFPEHVRLMKANDSYLMFREYEMISKGSPKLPADVCMSPENKVKNRYANIIAYDESRVILPMLEGDPHSDYINANYLNGYNFDKEYIATQGPVSTSINDFWRMVWHQRAKTIAMVTNLEERGRLKCNLYWPISGTVVYGQFSVELKDSMSLADFEIRTFKLTKITGCSQDEITKGLNCREVRQFHFTVWPDHGVPSHATPLLNFLRRLRAYQPTDHKPRVPIIVHCSAGVGRTGTLVVLDSMLTMAEAEGKIDVYGCVTKLRQQRNFMVQTEAQYTFIHDALVEALSIGDTEVPANALQSYINKVTKHREGNDTLAEVQFKKLSSGLTGTINFRSANQQCNTRKNRLVNVLPYEQSRVKLNQKPGVDGSDYINASFIDGYCSAKSFIATQGPLSETVVDFWTMVWKYNVSSVVMLSQLKEKGQEHSAEYWPTKSHEPTRYGDLLVKLEDETSTNAIVLRNFTITDTKRNVLRCVRHFQYIGWPDRGVPTSGSALLDLIGQVQRNQEANGSAGPVVVHCSSGASRTGVYCAVCIAIERVKLDALVDIFHTVKTMRMQRVSMVQTLEQYMFIYRTVLEYLDSFDLYSNGHGAS